jgi:hypothetical protein
MTGLPSWVMAAGGSWRGHAGYRNSGTDPGHAGSPHSPRSPADHRRPRTVTPRYGATWRRRRAHLAAGRLPAHLGHVPSALSALRPPGGLSRSAPADGRQPGRRRATAAAATRHPIGGACGPCRAAMKTYRKFSPIAGS